MDDSFIFDGSPEAAADIRTALEEWLADPVGKFSLEPAEHGPDVFVVHDPAVPRLDAVELVRRILAASARDAVEVCRHRVVELPGEAVDAFCARHNLTRAELGVVFEHVGLDPAA